jgi:hypothetical protein
MELKECGAEGCNFKDMSKHMKRVNGNWLCHKHYYELRKNNREHLKRDILGIRKRSDLLKEWKEKREQKDIPKINGAKVRGTKIRKKQNHLYLTRLEKRFLYIKYIREGNDYYNANKKLKQTCKNIGNLIEFWRKKQLSEELISQKFKEEFAKLLMQDD